MQIIESLLTANADISVEYEGRDARAHFAEQDLDEDATLQEIWTNISGTKEPATYE